MNSYRQYEALNKAGKYREAIPHARRTLELGEKEFGREHQAYATLLNYLALLYYSQGRYPEAEPLYKRALKIREKVLRPNHPLVGESLGNLALLYSRLGRYKEAESLYKRDLKITEKALGSDHLTVAISLNNLALLYDAQGRYPEAELLYKRSLKIKEKALRANHPSLAASLNNLAGLYEAQGRYLEAESLYWRSLKIAEKALGSEHPHVATSLNNLALLHKAQGRYKQAELLLKRSLSIREKARGPDHSSVADSLNNLAGLYQALGRYSEAEPLYRRSLEIRIKVLVPDHPNIGQSLNNLAGLYQALERYKQAEPLYRHALKITEKALGPHHPRVGDSLNNFAGFYHTQGRYKEAEPLYKRALKIAKKTLGPDHPDVGENLNNLAALYAEQSDWRQAASYWRLATGVLIRRAARFGAIGRVTTGKKESEVARKNSYFKGFTKSVFREERRAAHLGEMFETAQWAMQSQTAGALAQMAARQAVGSGELASLVRKRQDSVRQWQQNEKRIIELRGAGKRDPKLELRSVGLDRLISEIDKKLPSNFKELTNPKPLSIKQVQKLLMPNEALILLLDTPKANPTPAETFIWAVTQSKAVWKHAQLGGKVLEDKVAGLRRELDPTTAVRSGKEKRGFMPVVQKTGFSLKMAHELYEKLLGPVEDVIRDKQHLMIVGSGPLTALPFQVLIKAKPNGALAENERYKKADWLIRHHAITTLPSVASLKALRGFSKKGGRASQPMVGFADPVFSPPNKGKKRMAGPTSVVGGYARFFRGRNVDLATLSSRLGKLPGTRTELQGVAKILKVEKRHLKYGRDASEAAVKKAKLNQFRIVYFATHGLIAGDVKGLGEPALAFSLPAKATPLDDGLLTASEVTQLKLNADWVVMSACNTAAGDKPGAEALSGLARAFFYAGAKTLLVSHWPVGDEAAVKLTTRTFREIHEHPKLGKSEALRRSMLAMISKGGLANAHPTSWAPFVVVGEGGTAR